MAESSLGPDFDWPASAGFAAFSHWWTTEGDKGRPVFEIQGSHLAAFAAGWQARKAHQKGLVEPGGCALCDADLECRACRASRRKPTGTGYPAGGAVT